MSTEPVPRKLGLRHVIHTRLLSGSPSQMTLISIRKAPKRQEAGAGLIIIVLLAMLMLAALLVISANLSLSARRTTSDQKAILPAQYAAESGVAYAKSLLAASQDLIGQSVLPPNTTYGQMKTWIASLCGGGVTVPVAGYNSSTAGSTTIPGTSISVASSVKVCDVPSFSNDQAGFFANVVSNTGPAALKYTEYGIVDAKRQEFFKRAFSGLAENDVNGAKVKAGLTPVTLLQTGDFTYVFYFRVAGVDSTGISLDSKRRITVKGNDKLHGFRFKFIAQEPLVPGTPPVPGIPGIPGVPGVEPSFTSYGQFVNKWGSPEGVYGYRNEFSGPFHTNSIPSLRGASADDDDVKSGLVRAGTSISIDGTLTSTGCSDITTAIDALGDRVDTCVGSRRNAMINDVVDGTPSYITGAETIASGSQGGDNLFGAAKPKNPVFIAVKPGNAPPKFDTPFIRMPINSKNQRDLGLTAGIVVRDPQKVQFSTIGTGPTAIQVIEIVPSALNGGSLSSPVRLRYGSNKIMLIENPVGSGTYVYAVKSASALTGWAPAPVGASGTTFNGMVYADGSIDSLSGPTRPSPTSPSVNGTAPAIASFAGITVTAQNNATLTGDITYENRCLSISACTTKVGSEYKVKNIFGLYSASGDVRIAYNPNSKGQSVVPGSNAGAPQNLEIDGFVMAGRGHIIPYNVKTGTSDLITANCGSCNKGKFTVHGGTIKDEDAIVLNGDNNGLYGWSENYFYDGRGTDYSPPGFPTTALGTTATDGTTGTAGTAGTAPIQNPTTDSTLVTGWTPSLLKKDPDGTENGKVDFSLDNEVRQDTIK